MPLTLNQIQSLMVAIGLNVPEDILQQKAKAEEFQARKEKITAAATAKGGDWRLKTSIEDVCKRASDAADKKQFDPALKLLDEADGILQQPDVSPEVLAALKKAEERKAAFEAEVANAKALESHIGNELKIGLEAVSQALKEHAPEAAEKGLGELEQKLKDLGAARARVAALKAQVEKELTEAEAAVTAITEPALLAPEKQKLEALKQRQTAAVGLTAPEAQEKEYSTLVTDIAKLKQEAAAAKVTAEELKATQLRVSQTTSAVAAILLEIETRINGVTEQVLKDKLTATLTPLTQERARITTLAALDAQDAALTKLETDAQKLKGEAETLVKWDTWLKDKWAKDSKAIKTWVDDVKEQAAKAALQTEFDAALQQKTTFLAAGNYAPIQSNCHAKLLEIYTTAKALNDRGPKVDLEVHKARNLVVAVRDEIGDPSLTRPITQEFDALAAEKKSSWPAGANAAEMMAAMDGFDARLAAVRAKAETARGKLLGKDKARREAKIRELEEALQAIDDLLNGLEGTDWGEVAKLPDAEKAPLLKIKAEFITARADYKKLDKRLKAVGKIKNFEARGKELVALGKESSALVGSVTKRGMKLTIKKDGPAAVDKELARMPDNTDDPNEIALCKAIIEARFGIKIEIGEEFKAKSLPRLGKMLTRVPEWHTKQSKTAPDGTAKEKSLKTLSYQNEPMAKGNYYSSSRKTIALQSVGEKGENDEHTLVADSGKAVKTSYFDFTTLHEVGHAVDDRIKFMDSRMEKDGFGKWKAETFQSVLDALLPDLVAGCSGGAKKAQVADLQAMLTDLLKTANCAKPANAGAKLGSLVAEWDEIQNHPVVLKCKQGLNTAAKPWNKGKAHAQAVEVGGRVYQEAYDNNWYSYGLADRAATGLTTYQWRAPGEWFAELYALYYLNKMGRSHPMSSWFRNAAKSEEKAAKV
jgi:hypothetical protein